MEKYEYREILTDAGIAVSGNEKSSWKPLLRQCMICSGMWIIYFIHGLCLGLSTVLIAQIRREANSTEAVTDEMSSWLSSVPMISAGPPVLILPFVCYLIGRKLTFMIVCLLTIIGLIILYCSTNVYYVLISQVLVGTITAAINTFLPIIIVEYTSPKYRGIFLTLKSASSYWGIWVANAIGTFFYWKNIAVFGLVCSAYLITVFAWPESPYWLAMKGRYAESAKSHRWLKGVNENSEKELAKLICFRKKCESLTLSSGIDSHRCWTSFSTTWSIMTSRPFYKPTLLCIAIAAQYHFSGKFVISMYAIDVFKMLTQDDSFAFKLMLILDGVTVFSMYVGCILSRYCKRRTLMLSFTIIGILFLYTMSLYLYLVSLDVVKENHIVILVLLTIFSIAIGSGPIILITSIYGELVPSRFQNPIMIIWGLFNVTTSSILLKTLPVMIRNFTIHGFFLFFAIPSTVIIIIVYIYLPETKGKTVHEIEEYFDSRMTIELRNTLLDTKYLK